MTAGLTIGHAAREAKVGVETIRFYERKQLIEQPAKPHGSGPRLYSAEAVQRIRFIREAQRLGFALREVRELLSFRADPAADCSDVRERASAKLAEVRWKIEQLHRIQDALETLVAACPKHGGLDTCTIMNALVLPAKQREESCGEGQAGSEGE